MYLELPEIVGQPYLLNSKRIIISELESRSPTMIVDGVEFKGNHSINIGSNHFFSFSDVSKNDLTYEGTTIKITEFRLSHIPDTS